MLWFSQLQPSNLPKLELFQQGMYWTMAKLPLPWMQLGIFPRFADTWRRKSWGRHSQHSHSTMPALNSFAIFCYLLLLDDLYESLVCLVRFKKMTIRMIRTSSHFFANLISPCCRVFFLQGGEQMISVALQVGRRSIHPWPFWPCWRQVPRSSGKLR